MPQVVPPVNNPAFAEPEYATMNYDEMGNVVGSNQVYEDPDASAQGPHAGNAYGSLMPTYGQATPDAGGRPADPEYTHLDRGGAAAYASLEIQSATSQPDDVAYGFAAAPRSDNTVYGFTVASPQTRSIYATADESGPEYVTVVDQHRSGGKGKVLYGTAEEFGGPAPRPTVVGDGKVQSGGGSRVVQPIYDNNSTVA